MVFYKEIHDLIIKNLARNKNFTVAQLHKDLNNKKYTISLANLYREIHQLIDRRILIKEWQKLRLHSNRVIELDDLYKLIEKKYIKPSTQTISLQEGEEIIFYPKTLLELDPIGNDIQTQLSLLSGAKKQYFYQSHAYYLLWLPSEELDLQINIAKQVDSGYHLFGNDTILDRYGISLLQKIPNSYIIIHNDTPFLKDGYNIDIMWDYKLEVFFPDIITQYFKIFFDTIKTLKEFNREMFKKIFTIKAEYKIVVRHNKKYAEKNRNIIKSFFQI